MKFTWHGHSCFSIDTLQGIVTVDPFQDNYVPGFGTIRPVADAVYCSHGHGDHHGVDAVMLTGKDCNVGVETVSSFHDEAGGTKRGANLIHIFSAEGMKIIHMGDLGCELTEEQIAALKDPDVLLIPVGGFYTIDAKQAAGIVAKLNPRIVVPMHYRGEGFGFDVLAPVDDFLSLCSRTIKVLDGNCFEVTADTPAQVIVPKFVPANI